MFPVNKPELKALYDRIGGEGALERILIDFYKRMSVDTMIGYFFTGNNLRSHSIEEMALKQKQFLMKAFGATETFTGLAPAHAHTHLAPILSGHFDRRLRILEETLRDHKVDEASIKIWINFENAFRDGIQTK